MIKVKNAGVSFKKFRLYPSTITVPEGYVTMIVGPNGAGKTTFINMLLGLCKNMTGEIYINGMDVIKDREKIMNITGFISEDRELFNYFNAYENAEMYKTLYDEWDNDIYKKMLKDMEINPVAKYGDLSRGSKIKLQIALELAHNPKVLIMDEPTAALDPVLRMDFYKILSELVEKNVTILISTHLKDEFSKHADYRINIEEGRVSISEN